MFCICGYSYSIKNAENCFGTDVENKIKFESVFENFLFLNDFSFGYSLFRADKVIFTDVRYSVLSFCSMFFSEIWSAFFEQSNSWGVEFVALIGLYGKVFCHWPIKSRCYFDKCTEWLVHMVLLFFVLKENKRKE